jgi:2,3-bisphosphoglycerate-dependent phosphoglycerate mutase
MKQILLIRHGESEANAGLKTTVPAEVALTERGWAQARAVADFIVEKPSLVVISPYLRTKQTAQPLITKFPDVSVETWEIQEFTYLATERCRGTDYLDRKPLVEEFWRRRIFCRFLTQNAGGSG